MKTIYIDITNQLQVPFITGIQRCVIEFVVRLVNSPDCNAVLLRYDGQEHFEILDNQKYVNFFRTSKGKREECRTGKFISLNDMESGAAFFDIDAAWHSAFPRHLLYPELKNRNISIFPYVYDIIVITHPQYTSADNIVKFPPYLTAILLYADVIFTSAEFTALEMDKVAKQIGITREIRYCIVPLGSTSSMVKNDKNSDTLVDPIAKEIAVKGPYIFAISTIEPRKNFELLLDAFDKKLDAMGIQMVFAGRYGWNIEVLKDRMESHPHKNKTFFHLTGKNDETIQYLYRNAYMVAFPTFIEGFGLATVEALQHGAPVVASDVPVMREVGREFCDYVNPYDPDDLIRLVEFYRQNPEKYQEKKAAIKDYKLFTWEDGAQRIIDAIRSYHARKDGFV